MKQQQQQHCPTCLPIASITSDNQSDIDDDSSVAVGEGSGSYR
jgi:hypothetical protein